MYMLSLCTLRNSLKNYMLSCFSSKLLFRCFHFFLMLGRIKNVKRDFLGLLFTLASLSLSLPGQVSTVQEGTYLNSKNCDRSGACTVALKSRVSFRLFFPLPPPLLVAETPIPFRPFRPDSYSRFHLPDSFMPF